MVGFRHDNIGLFVKYMIVHQTGATPTRHRSGTRRPSTAAEKFEPLALYLTKPVSDEGGAVQTIVILGKWVVRSCFGVTRMRGIRDG